eukprot:5904492-Amphidinium_carterae.1
MEIRAVEAHQGVDGLLKLPRHKYKQISDGPPPDVNLKEFTQAAGDERSPISFEDWEQAIVPVKQHKHSESKCAAEGRARVTQCCATCILDVAVHISSEISACCFFSQLHVLLPLGGDRPL